jgi:hypothetical protein
MTKTGDPICISGSLKIKTAHPHAPSVFLAEIQRFRKGKLVEHQYLPPTVQANEKISRDTAWISVQSIIGETIILQNSFGTPRLLLNGFLTVQTCINSQRLRRLNSPQLPI